MSNSNSSSISTKLLDTTVTVVELVLAVYAVAVTFMIATIAVASVLGAELYLQVPTCAKPPAPPTRVVRCGSLSLFA